MKHVIQYLVKSIGAVDRWIIHLRSNQCTNTFDLVRNDKLDFHSRCGAFGAKSDQPNNVENGIERAYLLVAFSAMFNSWVTMEETVDTSSADSGRHTFL